MRFSILSVFVITMISAGQVPFCKITYNVDAGESCNSIAHLLNITVNDLECFNAPYLDCSNLQLHATICLDCFYRIENCRHRDKNPDTCIKHVTVIQGDSCYSIATSNGISISQLESLNPGLHCESSYISPGQVFCV